MTEELTGFNTGLATCCTTGCAMGTAVDVDCSFLLQPEKTTAIASKAITACTRLFRWDRFLIILNLFLIKESECCGEAGHLRHHPIVDIFNIRKGHIGNINNPW